MTTQPTVRDRTVSAPLDGRPATRPVVLEFVDLHKSFGGHQVLRGVSAQLRQGEVVLLRGDNGSGKTTLLNILSGNLEPDQGVIHLKANGSQEHFRFPRRWWQELNPFDHFTPERVAWEGVGRTWQDVRLFATASLADNIAAATPGQPGENPLNVLFRPLAVSRMEHGNRAKSQEILHSLGLAGRNGSSGDQVSLGQSKRVAIARAVQGGAKILFLDEPLAGLDRQGIEEVMALLASFAQQQGVTLVIVEHVFNIPRILNLAQTVWTLRDGMIQVEPVRNLSGQVSNGFDGLLKKLLDQFVGTGCQVHEQSLNAGAKLIRIVPSAAKPSPGAPILDLRSLVVRRNQRLVIGHRDQVDVVHGLSFTLCQGEVAILCAPNGWGKTTLLQAICGVIPMSQGQVILRGVDTFRLPTWQRFALGLRFIPSRNNLFPNLSIADFQALSRRPSSQVDPSLRPNRLIGELSGGERQQLTLADLSARKSLLILDEPFQGLDAEAITATIKRLGDFINARSGTLLIAQPSSLNDDSLSTH